MADDTLTPVQVVSAIFANLNAYTDLTDLVGGDIGEENFMEFAFDYPAVRVGINEAPFSQANSNCAGKWIDLSFSVFVFTEGESSRDCQVLQGLIARRFQDRVLSSADFRSLLLKTTYIPVLPHDVNAWRGEVLVTGQVRQT